jgi:Mg2+ and Co2+ transporter CorA
MKEIEKQILNKGFKNETLQKILNVKQELLKLNSAVQQGEEKKRQSESNKREFLMNLNRCQTHC